LGEEKLIFLWSEDKNNHRGGDTFGFDFGGGFLLPLFWANGVRGKEQNWFFWTDV
jgi:hypothetical protein